MKNKGKKKRNKRDISPQNIIHRANQSVYNESLDTGSRIGKTPGSRRDHSFDIGKESSGALKLLKMLKKRKAQKEKKVWMPTGPVVKTDAYNPSQKLYY